MEGVSRWGILSSLSPLFSLTFSSLARALVSCTTPTNHCQIFHKAFDTINVFFLLFYSLSVHYNVFRCRYIGFIMFYFVNTMTLHIITCTKDFFKTL